MIDALLGIVDFLVAIAEFMRNTVTSIAWVIISIPQFLGSITAVFAYCPTALLIWLEVCLGITVLFAVIKLLK